jgi:hypothetical protein
VHEGSMPSERADERCRMVSNLSTIGFQFADDSAFQDAMQRLTAEAFERLACDPGDYAIWRSRTSAEIWFHITGDRDAAGVLVDRAVVGLTPFFEGVSDVPIEIVEAVIRPGDNDFEGAFLAWVNPDPELGVGAHQIVFDAVDFAAHCDRQMPFVAQAKLTGFAREISVLASDDQGALARMSSSARSFMSIGLFANADSASPDHVAPSSNALLTARLIEHRVLMNEETNAPFHWLQVQTADATFDILADPELIPAKLVDGALLQIGCLFIGRIVG